MSVPTGSTRRAVLGGAFAALGWASPGPLGRAFAGILAPAALRVATLDWAVLETLLAIGNVPVAAAELVLYRQIVVSPPPPPAVVDVGLRGMPNYEALLAARPNLIVSTNFYLWATPALERIAPVETVTFYGLGAPSFELSCTATRAIADRIGTPAAGAALIARTEASLDAFHRDLAGVAGRPMLVINLGDARHFRVFGMDSLFGAVLARIGLANAWDGPTRYSASAPIGIERLAAFPDATIVILPPVPPEAVRMFAESRLWRALPAVRNGRVVTLDPVNPFGALPTAVRFGTLLRDALVGMTSHG
ncbi:iron-siderophore ABC transporter substrate-binding protein [Segnochrobactrum spirostomi]|uniref:iron-siderophore ABC transporter substrate-binding protein n=1 Tax=Segnochrobactrum spirostomi TaxID=2608987 RepID=UPI0028AC7EC4|nr:iron-siderophore ABC transporter substrate-binding protein [Segnochrobactrum spirostomi]